VTSTFGFSHPTAKLRAVQSRACGHPSHNRRCRYQPEVCLAALYAQRVQLLQLSEVTPGVHLTHDCDASFIPATPSSPPPVPASPAAVPYLFTSPTPARPVQPRSSAAFGCASSAAIRRGHFGCKRGLQRYAGALLLASLAVDFVR
jgi:hypothetical protein